MEPVLEVEQITKKYKRARVLDELSMHVNKGDIYGFVGNNGAGKTTLMRIIMRLANGTSGDYALFGIQRKDITEKEMKRVSAVIETPAFYPHLSGYQNLLVHQMSVGNTVIKEEINTALDKVNLAEAGKKKVRNYSLGMRQRLGLARALLNRADLIILDEPTNGLDPSGIIELRNIILELNKKNGTTFIISSHHITELQQFINKLGIIKAGKIVKEIPYTEVAAELEKTNISMEEYIMKYAN